MNDAKAEAQIMISDARQNFHLAVHEVLHDAQRLADSLAAAIGEVSPHQALTAWKRELAKRLMYDDIVKPQDKG